MPHAASASLELPIGRRLPMIPDTFLLPSRPAYRCRTSWRGFLRLVYAGGVVIAPRAPSAPAHPPSRPRAASPPPPPCRFLEERLGVGRQRRHFVGIERPHQPRRDQHHQLGLLGALGLALEQWPDDRQLAENRNRDLVVLRDVVEQPGDRERLAVAQLDVGFGAARRQRRNPETAEASRRWRSRACSLPA